MAGHTYSANPQSAAAALAVMKYIEEKQLIKKVAEQGNLLLRELKKLGDAHVHVGDVRGKGFLLGMELVRDKASGEPFPHKEKVTERLIKHAFSLGLLVYPALGGADGGNGDAILVAPPFTIEKEEVDLLLQRLDRAFISLEKDLKGN